MLESTPQQRSQVMISHREPLLLAGVASTLCAHDAFEVATRGIDVVSSGPPSYDVLVTDYDNAMRLAHKTCGVGRLASRILVLTTLDREADIRRAIDAGISGYLMRDTEPDELIEGVMAVARGARYLSRAAAMRMVDSLTRAELTDREAQVLQLVADGEPNKGIARRLQIEVGTVKSHLSAIMSKLGATSRTHAVRIATTRGLVRAPASAPA